MSGVPFNGKGYSDATMDSDTMDAAYHDSRFTAEISKRMQVPDRIAIGGQEIGAGDIQNGISNAARGGMNDSEHAASLKMQVPERILVAGGNSHVAAKNLPRELQLENSVLSPSPEQIRVFTPPRSIRLDDHQFPTVDQDDDRLQSSMNVGESPSMTASSDSVEPTGISRLQHSQVQAVNTVPEIPGRNTYLHGRMSREASDLGSHSLAAYKSGLEGSVKENMTPFEELQLVRRQIAKLNHRLMAVELENQQQQQREMIFSILVTAYFFGKFVMWVNRPN